MFIPKFSKEIILFYILIFITFIALVSGKSSAYFEDMFEDSATTDASGTTSENPVLSGAVYLEGEFLDGDILKISTFAENISEPVLGTAFHLVYDKAALAFLKYEPGDFLELGGDPFYLVQNSAKDGKILFGETLRQNDSFPVGDGKIVDLYFQIIDGTDFELKFENGVISSLDSVRQDMENVEWKNLSLSKNGFSNLLSYSNGEVSVLNHKVGFGFASILASLVGFFGLCYGIFRLIKKFRVRKRLQNFLLNS